MLHTHTQKHVHTNLRSSAQYSFLDLSCSPPHPTPPHPHLPPSLPIHVHPSPFNSQWRWCSSTLVLINFGVCLTGARGWRAGLADKAHVIKVGADTLYTAVLGLVDITRGTNSFYKLQALEGDQANRFAWREGSLWLALSTVAVKQGSRSLWKFGVEVLLYVHRNRRFIRDGEPRTSTSTFSP